MCSPHRLLLRITLAASGAACLAQPAAAQAEPGVLRGPAVNMAFSPTPPSRNQIYTDQLPGDGPGVFTCCLTVQTGPNVPPDVLMGRYDQVQGTFTPTNEANAFNTADGEGWMTLEPGLGRYAVVVRGSATSPVTHQFSARSGPGVPFPASVSIGGVPAGVLQIALGSVGGRLAAFYAQPDQLAVVMQDLDLSDLLAPKLTGTAQVVARPTSQTKVMPVTVVTGADGDVEGLLFTQGPGSAGTELVFQAGLHPTRPGSIAVPSCGSTCATMCGAIAGGRFLFASGSGPFRIQDVEVAWLLGDVVAPGGTADITGAVSRSPKASTLVLLSGSVIPKVKLPSPFHVGHLGIDLNQMLVLGFLPHGDASQRGSLSLPVPNDPNLRGFDGALQGLSLDAGNWPLAFTNTAWLSVR